MKITKNIWRLTATKGAGAYLIHTTTGYILIDTGFSFDTKNLRKELADMGVGELSCILLTHHDPDHIGSASVLQQKYRCKMYIHSLDMPYATGHTQRSGTKRLFDKVFKTSTAGEYLPLEDFTHPDIRIYHAPGHTPGHSLILYDKFLFCGDFYRNPKLRLRPYAKRVGWVTADLVAALQSMVDRPFCWLCPGHFVPHMLEN